MDKIIVLGIGNRLMMDDGIGIYLAEELSKQDDKSNIDIIIGESDVDYCLEQIEGASFVIMLDAVFSEKKPGELSVYRLSDLRTYQTIDFSLHNLHLFQVLSQQKATIEGFLIGVEPHEISFHIGLSTPLKEKWETIFQDVSGTIKKLIEKE